MLIGSGALLRELNSHFKAACTGRRGNPFPLTPGTPIPIREAGFGGNPGKEEQKHGRDAGMRVPPAVTAPRLSCPWGMQREVSRSKD